MDIQYSVAYWSEYFQYAHHRKQFYEFMASSTLNFFYFVNVSIIKKHHKSIIKAL